MAKLILTSEVSGLGSAGDVVEVKDGYVTVPRKPGLGIEVDEKLVRKYAV